MTAWQYAQLSITRDIRADQIHTILWRGPGQDVGENFTGSGQSVLELLNEWEPTAGSWPTGKSARSAATGPTIGTPTGR
jgi:hypothetical protein